MTMTERGEVGNEFVEMYDDMRFCGFSLEDFNNIYLLHVKTSSERTVMFRPCGQYTYILEEHKLKASPILNLIIIHRPKPSRAVPKHRVFQPHHPSPLHPQISGYQRT